MKPPIELPERSQTGWSLQDQAEFKKMRRQWSSVRFRKAFLDWLTLPVFVVTLLALAAPEGGRGR